MGTDLKSLMSNQFIQCHFNMYCAGLLPTIKSNIVKYGVKTLSDFDSEAMDAKLALLADNGSQGHTMGEGANSNKTRNQMESMDCNKVTAVLSSLKSMEQHQDSVLNINTMMTA